MSIQTERSIGLGRPLREVLDHIEGHPDRRLSRSGLFVAAATETPDALVAALLGLLTSSFDDGVAAVVIENTGEGRVVRVGESAPSRPNEVFAALDDIVPPSAGRAAGMSSRRPALVSRLALRRGSLTLAVWRDADEFSTTERARFIAIRAVAEAAIAT